MHGTISSQANANHQAAASAEECSRVEVQASTYNTLQPTYIVPLVDDAGIGRIWIALPVGEERPIAAVWLATIVSLAPPDTQVDVPLLYLIGLVRDKLGVGGRTPACTNHHRPTNVDIREHRHQHHQQTHAQSINDLFVFL